MQILANRRSHRATICLLASLLCLGLAGCGTTNWGFPYRTTIQQGNWITSEQVAQLEVGMTRDQVRFLLGTPTLQDAFHADRWDYPYYNQPGYGKDVLRKFTIWFDNDRVVRWDGDKQPDHQPFQKLDTGHEPAGANGAVQPAAAPAPNAGTTPEANPASPAAGALPSGAAPTAPEAPGAAVPDAGASPPAVMKPDTGADVPAAAAPDAAPTSSGGQP